MISPIYPGGVRSAGGVNPHEKKSETTFPRTSEQRFDQVRFSSHLDEMEKRLKITAGQISQQVRIRPTHQELESLRQQVASGTYQTDPREVAARMLLREDG